MHPRCDDPLHNGRRPLRGRVAALVALGVVLIGVAGCSGDPADRRDASEGAVPSVTAGPTMIPTTSLGPGSSAVDAETISWDDTDTALRRRVSDAGLAGGMVRVVRDGVVIHDLSVGAVGSETPLDVASTAKWLTAAAIMTFVDDGAASLDDPVDRWLPEFADEDPPITLRELLNHTSGVRDQPCLWDPSDRLADCVRRVAASPREFDPGEAFSYGNADFHVAGRVLEEMGGDDFATVFDLRIGEPLGLTATTWPGAPGNPSPAAGVRTTVRDYSRFLALILGRGVFDGDQILSSRSVDELVRNQIPGYDTSHDQAVAITGIPRYSLGAWPDVVDGSGTTRVVSGNGGKGYYPWVDFDTNSYGIVAVQDDRGAGVAVPASQNVAVEARQALEG